MTTEVRDRLREQAASIRAMIYPGAVIEPVATATIRLMLDIADALLAGEDA